MNQDTIAAILSVVIGAVLLFYGYPVFRIVLPFFGLIFGYYLGRELFPTNPALGIGVGIVLAIVFTIMAYQFWSLLIGLAGLIIGFGVGVQVALFLGLASPLDVVFGVVGALIGFLLFFANRDLMVIIQSALAGAGAILFGLATLIPQLNFLDDARQGNRGALIVYLVLAGVGILAQLGLFSRRRTYYRRR